MTTYRLDIDDVGGDELPLTITIKGTLNNRDLVFMIHGDTIDVMHLDDAAPGYESELFPDADPVAQYLKED